MRVKFWSEKVKRRDHLEDKGVDGGVVKMNIVEIGWKGVDWINSAHDRSQ
jgi:hypothetical protein